MTTKSLPVSAVFPEGSKEFTTVVTTTQTCTNSVANDSTTAMHYYVCSGAICSFWKWEAAELERFTNVPKPATADMPTKDTVGDWSDTFITGAFSGAFADTVPLTNATGATKWDSDGKVATDVQTENFIKSYIAPTQAQIDAAKKIADALPKTTNTSSTPTTVPKNTVVSGLQFVQGTLSPTVIGTEDLA